MAIAAVKGRAAAPSRYLLDLVLAEVVELPLGVASGVVDQHIDRAQLSLDRATTSRLSCDEVISRAIARSSPPASRQVVRGRLELGPAPRDERDAGAPLG